MDISNPISAVVPSSNGHVLKVLARTDVPLSARAIAKLTEGQVSHTQVGNTLRHLVSSGVVLGQSHPPANLYRLNREHVAASAIVALSSLRDELLGRMRHAVEEWKRAAKAVWLFGSLSRGEGDVTSDIDVLVLRDSTIEEDDQAWIRQLAAFAADVKSWSGNTCNIVEYGADEFNRLISSQERLPVEIARDGTHLYGDEIPRLAIRRANI